jgi:hypothetical protein
MTILIPDDDHIGANMYCDVKKKLPLCFHQDTVTSYDKCSITALKNYNKNILFSV